MKNILLALLLAVCGVASAASTDTPTPTFTPTVTWTPSAIPNLPVATSHEFIGPTQLFQSDNVTVVSAQLTPLPGGNAWIATTLSQTSAVLSTGTAGVRFGWTVPANYPTDRTGNAKLYMYATLSTLTDTASFAADVSISQMGNLTSTSLTSVYKGLTINACVYTFATYSTVTGTTQPYYASRWSRVLLPLSNTAAANMTPGDQVNFNVWRAGGTSGDWSIYRFEVEYDPARPRTR